MYGFEVGRIYDRRSDIHARYSGQQQGGIITPRAYPVVIIITGEAGQQHGYADHLREDGVFEYFGEGQKGDMEFIRGNAAIASHATDGKDLLLFRKEGRKVRFMGEWVCAGYRFQSAPDTDGAQRQAIVFELASLEDLHDAPDSDAPKQGDLIDELRLRAFAAATLTPIQSQASRSIYQRSRDVRDYVVARANGHCEGCRNPAPFVRRNGLPYLEPHHLRRLSDGGPDDPRYVIALCPTCHRLVHFGADGDRYNDDLKRRMADLEPK